MKRLSVGVFLWTALCWVIGLYACYRAFDFSSFANLVWTVAPVPVIGALITRPHIRAASATLRDEALAVILPLGLLIWAVAFDPYNPASTPVITLAVLVGFRARDLFAR